MQVPGCSREVTQAHHVVFRSRLGPDTDENLVGLCTLHHLRSVHEGWLTVTGSAPDGLDWRLDGRPLRRGFR